MLIANPIILIVDDDDSAGVLMTIAFERGGFTLPPRFVRDGEEAIEYLDGVGVFGNRKLYPLPTAVLLDLNMPKKNGFEVLAWIRKQPSLKRLRVYVLSASSRLEDIERAYDLGANSYLVKPGNLEQLLHLVNTLKTWLSLSHFGP